jgi:protoporphyrinogen IX oxidase
MEYLTDYYLWIKAFHIIFVIFWCAGLLMMPRFFAYHMQCEIESAEDVKWQDRENRLLHIIMNPALIIVWLLGFILLYQVKVYMEQWFLVKLLFVAILTTLHMLFAIWRKKIALGQRPHSEKFYRLINEFPSLLIIIIVIMVIVKPF